MNDMCEKQVWIMRKAVLELTFECMAYLQVVFFFLFRELCGDILGSYIKTCD